MHEAATARSASVGDLLTVLGSAGVRLASSERGRHLAVSGTVLLDPQSALSTTTGGILLAPTVRVAEPPAAETLAQAADRGFAAVVVKEHGSDPTHLSRVADELGIALLVVHDDVAWLQLDTLLGQSLVSATRVGRSLSGAALGDLFVLAQAIADTVGGATAIEDFSQRILAYSHREDQPTDAERREGILGRQVPDLPGNAEQYREVYRSEGVVRIPASPDGLPRIAVAIRAGRELLGSIWVVDPTGDLAEEATESLRGAAPIAALHLLQARSAVDLVRHQRSEAARQLLDAHGDPGEAAIALGLAAHGPYGVLAVTSALPGDEPLDRLSRMVTLQCESRLGTSGTVVIGSTVLGLVSGPRVEPDALRAVGADIVGAAASLSIRVIAGVGPVVHNVASIPESRREAGRVLALLHGRPELGPVATTEEVSDQLVLAALGQALAQDPRLVPASARAVRKHDARCETTYVALLRAYLDCGRDIGATAARLTVHPNTVRYRLRRAVDLFGLNVTDAEQMLPLWLALRVAEPPPPDGP